MAFYLYPPSGNASLLQLESWAFVRLEVLLALGRCRGNMDVMLELMHSPSVASHSDCLLEGSRRDLISHHILRLVSTSDPEMAKFFLLNETALFRHRLFCLIKHELYSCIRQLDKFHQSMKKNDFSRQRFMEKQIQIVLNVLDHLTDNYTWWQLVNYYHRKDQTKFVRVPFEIVIELVAKRAVVLDRGFARVPCTHLDHILTAVFHQLLRLQMLLVNQRWTDIRGDERIDVLAAKLKRKFRCNFHPNGQLSSFKETLRCKQIDSLVEAFPLCMSSIHANLRTKHRLHHNSRIQYTLFLKDIGLPIEEALQFWQEEYSMPRPQSDKRLWEVEKRRYSYNIRHLYGLEGSRISCRSHCCQSLQGKSLRAGEEGGCPFKHYDETNLSAVLTNAGMEASVHQAILDCVRCGNYRGACVEYYTARCRAAKQEKLKVVLCEDDCECELHSGNASHCCSDMPSVQTQHLQVPSPINHHGNKNDANTKNSKSEANFVRVKEQSLFDKDIDTQSPVVPSLPVSNEGSTGVSRVTTPVSCYDKEICPCSQVIPQVSQSNEAGTARTNIAKLEITKPVDFYSSYKLFLSGLS